MAHSRPGSCALLAIVLGACSAPAPVHVQARLAGGAPLADLEIAVLPFDPAVLLDSLSAAAATPQPRFPDLESRLRAYQPAPAAVEPASPGSRQAEVAARATRDSVRKLSAALSRMDRTAPGYREEYARFRDLYARYTAREAARETEVRKLDAGDRALAREAARAADSLRRWEQVAYRDFPRLAAERATASGRGVVRARTDSAGHTLLALPAGRWWVSARLAEPANPFVEYRWNAPLQAAAGLPFSFPLSLSNAEAQWRH